MKTDYLLTGQQRGLAEPRASLVTARDRAIASVKKAIWAAGLSDNLDADPKELSLRISTPIRQEGHLFFRLDTPRGCSHDE